MEARKAIKKMVALGTGLAMVGATVFGAAAADLSEYPSPMFIEDGAFDGVIIVGANAAADDVIGATDVISSLQYASTTTTEVSTSSVVEPTVSEGVKIAKSGDELNLDQDLADVENKFDDVDLPDILPDKDFNDEDGGEESYTQLLELGDEAQVLQMYQDEDDAPTAGVYLQIVDGMNCYNYTLEFDDAISGTNGSEDESDVQELLESATIEIQGNTYTITSVDLGTNQIDKLTLQAGETTIWLEEGVEVSKPVDGVTHIVKLNDVNEDEDKCGIYVDDTLAWVDKGTTETINGLDIGVTDAIVVHSAGKDTDVCQVNLGAAELVLDDDNEVSMNNAEVDGSDVQITVDSNNEWTGFIITYVPDSDGEVYLGEGETWVDPVLGNFEIKYAGLTETVEEMEMNVIGNKDAEFKFINNDNKEVTIPFFYSDTNSDIYAGTDDDKLVLREGDSVMGTASTDITDIEDYYLWVVASNGEAHMIQIDDIDTTDDEIKIDDITYDKTYTDDFDNDSSAVQTVSLGSFLDIQLQFNSTYDWVIVETENATAESKYDAEIDFNKTHVMVEEIDTNRETSDVTLDMINISLQYTSSDDMQIQSIDTTTSVSMYESEEDSDVEVGRTVYGTLIETDTEDDDYVKLTYPDESVYGNVFISPIGADVISGAGAGAVTTTTLNRINVGAAMLDSEVADVTAVNAIVVGGPCANSAAAELMGNPASCWEALPQNKAILKLYENGENVALLAAGSTALDTRRASRVLANYDSYDLSGMEVEVTGTSISDISVSAPASE